MAHLGLLAALAIVLAAGEVGAQCCRVVKTDAETPSSSVRVCQPGPARSCATELFAGALALGEGQDVCVASDTLVYQEVDPDTGAYGEPVEARCDGGDVEL